MSQSPILFIIPGVCSFGSQITLELLSIPYQIGITTPEIRASDKFRKINPTGKVGALKDGENTIGENLAILLYLADKYPNSSIAPKVGTVERSKVYQWLSYLSSTLHPAFGQNLFPENFISSDLIENFKQIAYPKLINVLTYINQELAKTNRKFINSNLTIVDAQAYALLKWTKSHRKIQNLVDLKPFPQIELFLNEMEQHQAVQNALSIEQNRSNHVLNSKFSGYYEF